MATLNSYNTISRAASGASNWIPLNPNVTGSSLGLLAVVSGGATLTFNLEYTLDTISNPTDATSNTNVVANFSGKTATTDGQTFMPMGAVRINITSYTSGTVTLFVRQQGIYGPGVS